MLDYLQSPLNQFIIYIVLMIMLLLVKRLYAPTVILGGTYIIVLWMFLAALSGISSSVDWSYFYYLIIALFVAYAFLWFFAWVADRWGPAYNSEGAIALLIPLVLSGLILIPIMVLKGAIQVVSYFV
ncbi:hypothetical protein MNBD_GAMMA12-3683 [hydrothermal vent metagenome]|uniref:Uncharacterized protein n=1 Tax=hydrothermal vent metagenome TaxID=652676 RepID=A0A3B0ZM65_9ZZZZ